MHLGSIISGAVDSGGVSFCGDGVGGDVKLDFICIAVKHRPWRQMMVRTGKKIYDKQVRVKHRTLRDTLSQMSYRGGAVVDVNKLLSVSEVWFKAGEHSDVEVAFQTLREQCEEKSRMLWLMVSMTALRLRRIRMLRWLQSEEWRRPSVTLRRAVSVLCWKQKPDWLMWDLISEATRRSLIFDGKGRLEMGLKLHMLSEFSPGFLRMRVMA